MLTVVSYFRCGTAVPKEMNKVRSSNTLEKLANSEKVALRSLDLQRAWPVGLGMEKSFFLNGLRVYRDPSQISSNFRQSIST